jgi:hypothetical protein
MAPGRLILSSKLDLAAFVLAAIGCTRSEQQPAGAAGTWQAAAQVTAAVAAPAQKHAVIAHLPLSDKTFGDERDLTDCQALEDALEQDIIAAHAGEMDGNEIGGGECTLFMYGPNADKLFDVISRRLRASRFAKGAWVIKRYGAAGDRQSRESRIDL